MGAAQTAHITMDLAEMPFEHLMAVLSFFLAALTVVFINGFSVRIGEKELHIGGIRRFLAKKDEDTLLKKCQLFHRDSGLTVMRIGA
jgi:hypothetical protein